MSSEVLSYSTRRSTEPETIGSLLHKARKQAGLTRDEVAKRLGTRNSAISRLERMPEGIRISTLERYAQAVGYDVVLELRPTRKT